MAAFLADSQTFLDMKSNQTLMSFGGQEMNGTDYAEFVQFVNSFNWSEADSDPFSVNDWFNLSSEIDPVSWDGDLNNTFNKTSLYENASTSASIPDSFWEAGKVRIPLYSIIFLLGITGNCLVIITILQHSRMRTVTNLFLLNLAISDLLLGVFCMPFTLVGALLRDFVFGEVFCKLIPFLQAVSVSVSGWTLVAISVERFYAICHPLTSRKWQTRRHARYIILAVWLGSLAIMSPVAVLSQLKPVGNDGRRKCREVWPDENLETGFTLFLDGILLVIPLFLMAAMYGLIVNHLWKVDQGGGGGGGGDDGASYAGPSSRANFSVTSRNTSANRNLNANNQSTSERNSAVSIAMTTRPNMYRSNKSTTTNNSSNAGTAVATATLRRCNPEHCLKTKRRVLKMLIVVVLEFFVCWTPLYVVNTISFFAPKAVYEGLGYTGISLVQLLAQTSVCCNPITYCFMSSSFRRAFLKLFGCAKEDNFSRSVGTV